MPAVRYVDVAKAGNIAVACSGVNRVGTDQFD